MDSNPVTVVVRYQAQPGLEDRAAREFSALLTAVVSEPACHGIELHQEQDDPTRFLLHERWASREAYFGAHMETAHLRAFIARAPEFLAGPPDIRVWNLLGTFGGASR